MNRRAFIHTVTIAGAAAALPRAVKAAAKKDADPIEAHPPRQAARLARALKKNPRQPDTIAALAANLRLHAAHNISTGFDGTLGKTLRRQIARDGREAVIDRAMQ